MFAILGTVTTAPLGEEWSLQSGNCGLQADKSASASMDEIHVVCNPSLGLQPNLTSEPRMARPSDIAAGFAEHGNAVFDLLVGTWSVLVWDEAKSEFWAASDRSGSHLLYYRNNSEFRIANTILGALGDAPRIVNLQAVSDYCHTGAAPATDTTWLEGVHRLPSGHVFHWADGKHDTRPLASLDSEEPTLIQRTSQSQLHGEVALLSQGRTPEVEVTTALNATGAATQLWVTNPARGELAPEVTRIAQATGAIIHDVEVSADRLKADLLDYQRAAQTPCPDLAAYLDYVRLRAISESGTDVAYCLVDTDAAPRKVSAPGLPLLRPISKLMVNRYRDSVAQLLGSELPAPSNTKHSVSRVDWAAACAAATGVHLYAITGASVAAKSEQSMLRSWLLRLKGMIYDVFKSPSLGSRGWTDQRELLSAFEEFIAGKSPLAPEVFWRILNAELWARDVLDQSANELRASSVEEYGQNDPPPHHEPLTANPDKNLDIDLSDTLIARRYPIQTGKFTEDISIVPSILGYVTEFFEALDAALAKNAGDHRMATEGRTWNLAVSEKIIAIMQGRAYFVWDIHPSWAAIQLSKRVTKTPAGIGLGDPVTMQLAIQEAGLPRVAFAAAVGAMGKLVKRHGLFYQLVGHNIRAIDGPTEYSVYPANVSAKLPPDRPDEVAHELSKAIRGALPERWVDTFAGTVVMDANDLGRNCLGKDAPQSNEHYEQQFADNPLGQGRQQTPLCVVFERAK